VTPFAVVCPTCGAKLVVTKAEQIGDVELCPSCRSMVLIEPPTPTPGGAHAPVPPLTAPGGTFLGPDGEEATETGSVLGSSLDEGVTESVDVSRAEAVEADRARGKRSRFLVDEAVPPPTSDSGRNDAPRHDSPPGGVPVPPAVPADRAEPRRLQHALILAAATVTGIGVAAILFVIVVIATRSRPQDVATTDPDLPVIPAPDDPDLAPVVAPDPAPEDVVVPVDPDEGPGGPPAVEEIAPPATEGDDPAPAADAMADPAVDGAIVPPDDDPADGMPAEAPMEGDDVPPAAPADGDVPPIFGAADPATPPPAPADSEAAELAELLERIAPGSSRDPFGAEDPAAAATAREREEDLAALRAVMIELVNAGGDEAERPPLREADVEERLADEIVRVRVTDLPVDRFLHQITAISAIPLQWDPDVRRLARLREDTRVTVRIDEATTVGALLDAGLGPLGFGAVPREGFVEILKGERPLELREATIPWEQIPIPAALREEFVAKVRAWIDASGWGDDPAGRTIAATEEGIAVRQIETELFKIDLLIDRLRMAMGQDPARGTPTELLDPQPAHLRGRTILEQPAELVALRPVPLEQALSDLSQSTGLAIAVDWNSLLASGWGPTSEATFEAPKAPLRETLAASLRKLGLGYRTVDDGTVQVLSPEALALGVEIEIYRLDESVVEGDPAKFVQTLNSELNAALGEGFNAGQGLWISPADRLLVAALPRPAQVWLHRRLNPAAKTASR
jgi:DNA-directed RNA polymerase subunit RPC12/RpoP